MLGRFRTTFTLVVGLLLVGTVTSVDAGWHSGTVLESFRSWLGQPGERTKLTVDHTDSGVVLELVASDTATVNQLQAALPKQKTSLSKARNLRREEYSGTQDESNTSRTRDNRYEDDEDDEEEDDEDEDRSEDDEDHDSD